MDNKYFHSPAQTAKLKYDLNCQGRHIETLEESLVNARKKYENIKSEMIGNCEHEYESNGEEWMPGNFSMRIEMRKMECKKCGHTVWKIKKED